MGREDQGQIVTLNREMLKAYYVRNASRQITSMYQAAASASHGDVAIRTQYTYDVNGDVEKTLESVTTWDSTWEI